MITESTGNKSYYDISNGRHSAGSIIKCITVKDIILIQSSQKQMLGYRLISLNSNPISIRQ